MITGYPRQRQGSSVKRRRPGGSAPTIDCGLSSTVRKRGCPAHLALPENGDAAAGVCGRVFVEHGVVLDRQNSRPD
eukprot:827142-Pyramimonas_sp.AAC.1